MEILILNIFIQIWNFIFQLWKFSIEISNNHLIWTWNLNSKLLFWILKINTFSLKILIESKNGHFNFEYYYLNMKFDISILESFI
jgi:hypothetical protein